MRRNTFVSLCSLTEIKIAGAILLLILLAGLQGIFKAWYDSVFLNPAYLDTWVTSGRFIHVLDGMIREATILGVPLIIGIGLATAKLRLRCMIPLIVLYALIVLQFIVPLRSVLMGLAVSNSELTYWERCTAMISGWFHNFPLERRSVFLYIEVVLTFTAACLVGWWASRRRGQLIDLRAGKRIRMVVTAICILLLVVTILSLFGTITRPLLRWAASISEPKARSPEINMQYLLLGPSMASWGRPGAGGRGPILLFSWVLFVVACLYGARRLTTRQTLALAGIFAIPITLTHVITSASENMRAAYVTGLQFVLLVYSHPEDSFWLYHIPYPVTYLLQMLFCAVGLLGSAALFRALTRKTAE